MSEKRTRAEVRAELDESYDTAYYRWRVLRRAPWKIGNIAFNVIAPVIIGLLFQQETSWIIGFIILYFALDFILYGIRNARWNHQVKKYGLESFRAQFDPTYEKDGK